MLRAVLAAAVGLATLSGFAGADARSAPPQLRGFADGTLVRVDPQSLAPLPGRGIRLGSGGCAPRSGGTACWTNPPWTVAPNTQRLAVARNDVSSLQIVDPGRMRVTASIRVDGGAIGALAWLAPGRLVALQEVPGERQRLLAVDLAGRKVTARTSLGGFVQRLARTTRELVLLVSPAKAIGPARIAVADSRGAVRFVRLERILAGTKLLGTGSEHRVEVRLPGLAVDPQARRAFVVDRSVAAEVDLRSLAVSYHALERRPASAAKQSRGHIRDARWLGGNLLAVSGTDTEESRTQPAGLVVADTRDWTVATIDGGATSFAVAGDLLLAMGGGTTGSGVAAYGLDGRKRFHVFDGQQAWVSLVYGGRAYVGTPGQQALQVVDLASGSVVATRKQPLPWLLIGRGAGWWDG